MGERGERYYDIENNGSELQNAHFFGPKDFEERTAGDVLPLHSGVVALVHAKMCECWRRSSLVLFMIGGPISYHIDGLLKDRIRPLEKILFAGMHFHIR